MSAKNELPEIVSTGRGMVRHQCDAEAFRTTRNPI